MFDELSFGELTEVFDSIEVFEVFLGVEEGSLSSRQSSSNTSSLVESSSFLDRCDSFCELLIQNLS